MTEQDLQGLVIEIERLNDIVRKLYTERVSLIMTAEMNEAQLLAEMGRLREKVKSSQQAFKRKRKEAKILANACRKHKVQNSELAEVLSYYLNADNYIVKNDLC